MLDLENLKASIILKAMVAGLLKSKNDTGFVVEMTTYGGVENNLCYGCAATVTLAEMFGGKRSASEMMLGYVKAPTDRTDFAYAYLSEVISLESSSVQESLPITLRSLERAVNNARQGEISVLIELLTGEVNESFDYRWSLGSINWEEKLPDVEATIAEMEVAGY